jgi:hypothetical protein
MFDQSAGARRRMDAQTRLVKMMAAMQYAGLVGLLALTSRPPRSPKPERRCLTAIPLTTVSRTTVGSAEEQKVYCEGWRAFRKDW